MSDTREMSNQVVGIKEWLISVILASIPVVGVIFLLVWAFSSKTAKSKANWAKAFLILLVLATVFSGVFWENTWGNLPEFFFDFQRSA